MLCYASAREHFSNLCLQTLSTNAGEADGAGDQEMIEVDLDFIQMHEVGCCAVLQVLC